jgi:hypothetical protein
MKKTYIIFAAYNADKRRSNPWIVRARSKKEAAAMHNNLNKNKPGFFRVKFPDVEVATVVFSV